MFKFESKYRKFQQQKKAENVSCFWDNSIWKAWNKMLLLRGEYLSSAVNGLRNSPKILYISQIELFNPNRLHRDQWIWQRCFRQALNSDSACFPSYLSKGPLKRQFLGTYLTTYFEVRKFKNTSPVTIALFLKIFKIKFKFRKCKKKIRKYFLFLR